MDDEKKVSRKGKAVKTILAAGIFIAGYFTNNLLADPAVLQKRLQEKVNENPAQYTLVMQDAFGFSYNAWLKGNYQNGVDTSATEGIAPSISTANNKTQLNIEDHNNPCKTSYSIRRLDSDIAKKLGTGIALGTQEQSIDQFISTIAEDKDVLEKYPAHKKEILADYTAEEIGKAASGLYNDAKKNAGKAFSEIKQLFR